MIVFDLKCQAGHVFEAWFRSSGDFDDQQRCDLVTCPMCGTTVVSKAVMAPRVDAKGNQLSGRSSSPESSAPHTAALPDAAQSGVMPSPEQVRALFRAVGAHVRATCDDVGDSFTTEVRAIHHGDAPERGIYGSASAEDVKDLLDEGIDVMPVPDLAKSDH